MKYLLLLFLTLNCSILKGQGPLDNRIQYDEFIYSLTVPHLKNISQIAEYYNIHENDIYEVNHRRYHYKLAYKYKHIIYLPAGTLLKNENIAFKHLEKCFQNLPNYTIVDAFGYPIMNQSNFAKRIEDTLVLSYLFTDSAYAVATINLGNNYIGYFTEEKEENTRRDFIYIFFHNDYLTRIQVGGYTADKYIDSIFKDFDNDGQTEILVKEETDKETYYSVSKDHGDKKEATTEFGKIKSYTMYKNVFGMYENVSLDTFLKIVPE